MGDTASNIGVSDHAKLRWMQRHAGVCHCPGVRLRELWERGVATDTAQVPQGVARRVREGLLLVADEAEKCILTVKIDRGGQA